MVDSTIIVPFIGDDSPTPTNMVSKQPDAADIIGDNRELVEETNEQPDAALPFPRVVARHLLRPPL